MLLWSMSLHMMQSIEPSGCVVLVSCTEVPCPVGRDNAYDRSKALHFKGRNRMHLAHIQHINESVLFFVLVHGHL